MPAIAGLVALAVLVSAVTSAVRNAETRSAATRPIELISPRLVGEDNKQRAFVITAATAERENDGSARIRLNNPILLRDQGGADQMRVTAARGVYDEAAGKLDLAGDVRLVAPNGVFATPSAVYDAKTGELVGTGAVQAAGATGEMKAGSFAVKDKGKSVVYKGGVHTRLNVK
jgi:lipopolysaccharide export system protein LptC